MKKLIASLAILSMSSAAFAGDAEVSHSGDFAVRYKMTMEKGMTKDSGTENDWMHRFRLGTTFRSGEKFSAHLRLIHATSWGATDTSTSSTNDPQFDTFNDKNGLVVNQAYGTWMVNNDVILQAGRMPVAISDGTVFSENDYELVAYSWEGVHFGYDTEFSHFDVFALNENDFTTATASGAKDPEMNLYVFNADIKALPEFLKAINVHIIKMAGSEVTSTTPSGGTSQAVDRLDYGLTFKGDTAGVDYRLTYAANGGKLKTSPSTETKLKGTMMDLEVGYSMPTMMNSRFSLGYHNQSGDDSGSDYKAYIPVAYDKHYNSGLMDIVTWNGTTVNGAAITGTAAAGLSDINVEYSMSPSDSYTAGLAYHIFTTAEKISNETDLGSELDVTASKMYEGGMKMTARISMFSPGKILKAQATSLDKSQNQFFLEAAWKF